MAAEFGKSRNTIRMWIAELAQQGLAVQRPYSNKYGVREVKRREDPPKQVDFFDKAWDEYRELIGMSKKHKPPKPRLSKVGHRRKIVALSDTHGFPNQEGLLKLREEKPDIVHVVGDVFDAQAYSTFVKSVLIPIEIEMANIRAMGEFLNSFCKSVWRRGNHDTRVFKFLVRRVGPEYMHLVHTDLFALSLQGLENCDIASDKYSFTTATGEEYEDTFDVGFFSVEGDAVFGHAETARKGELNTVRPVAEWFDTWRQPLGMKEPRLIGQAHVHRAGIGFPRGGHRIVAELGCLLNPKQILQYQMEGDTRYSPPALGFLVIEQDLKNKEWVTDVNSIRYVLV